MKRYQAGIIAGLAFALIDIIPMFFMALPDRYTAIAGAFVNRFAIGFFIYITNLPIHGILKGLLIGCLISLPDAIITSAYGPILGIGIIGGIVIGFIESRFKNS